MVLRNELREPKAIVMDGTEEELPDIVEMVRAMGMTPTDEASTRYAGEAPSLPCPQRVPSAPRAYRVISRI